MFRAANVINLKCNCREDSESEDDAKEQEIPAWAQDANLRREIVGQQRLDPDELFQQHEKTCPLDEVFASLKTGETLPHWVA